MPPIKRNLSLQASTNTHLNQSKHTALSRNDEIQVALTNRYDALNRMYAVAENHLKALKPIREVFIRYGRSPELGSCEILGIEKYRGEWRLVHGIDVQDSPDNPETKPIVECAIEIRIRAVDYVTHLHRAIVEDKERFIPTVDAAINTLVEFCSRV